MTYSETLKVKMGSFPATLQHKNVHWRYEGAKAFIWPRFTMNSSGCCLCDGGWMKYYEKDSQLQHNESLLDREKQYM